MRLMPRARLGAVSAIVGGALWVPYGVFEMLEPWGAGKRFQEEVGYSVITDASLFVAYSLPGALALLLSTVALLALTEEPMRGGWRRVARITACAAMGLAVMSVAGVAILLDPLFTATRIFGTLALGAATLLAGLGVSSARDLDLATAAPEPLLLGLGVMGLLMLPLWPVVYAVQAVSETGGAAFIALFGAGWVALGIERSRPGRRLPLA